MEKIKKIQMVTGGLLTILFFTHVVQMALLLVGWVNWSPIFKYSGITFMVIMVIHIILCILNVFNRQQRDPKFYRLKWITGIIICLFLIVHGDDYMGPVRIFCFHFDKGIIAACIELLLLFLSTLHIRLNVSAMCDHLGMEEKKKLIWSRISCGIATLTILLPGIAIWNYFM